MAKGMKVVLIVVSVAILLSVTVVCEAQKAKKADETPKAPVPAQILSAKKVFIANGGGDESRFESQQYTGGPDRLYNEFYLAMKSWGRYEMVSTPAEAELVFEISQTVVQVQRTGLHGDADAYDPQFRLTIRDVQTHTVLWGLTEHAQPAILQDNRDKNFESALYWIVFELKKIASPAPGGANPEASSVK